ncbi:MAG: lipoyl synthase [Chloroflexi bacterium]|nr:lipoyl synthase [Chloroflexota bacterium]
MQEPPALTLPTEPPARPRLPSWIRAKFPGGPSYLRLQGLLRSAELHTVCEEARCPNMGECWEWGTATFLILGDTCTRTCGYCAIKSGLPQGLDLAEPDRVARTVERLGLRHAVVTSVNRDELPDGGARVFAATIRRIRARAPGCTVEVLIPDFKGSEEALATVMATRPDILNHNTETVPRLYRRVRPGGRYARALELLCKAKEMAPQGVTKSGVMVGLGESWEELLEVMDDLRAVRCDVLTIGQYLRPSKDHLPVERFYPPEEFLRLKEEGLARGFGHVESGPLVRSSYHAHEQAPPKEH